MSSYGGIKRISVADIRAKKGQGSIVSLTAYSKPMAKLMDELADVIIVGDSVGMVLYGYDSTLAVSMSVMIEHGAAVVRGARRACVVVDMPFASYQKSKEQAFSNAARLLVETGAQGVKLEAGQEMLETVSFLVERGIPVMAHIGLKPQFINSMGGFKIQGKDSQSGTELLQQAKAFESVGAFAILVEGVYEPVAANITAAVSIPVIGIGASPACDGQVLVTDDLLALFNDYTPKFVKQYANLTEIIQQALADYAKEVRDGQFPQLQHCFTAK